MEVEKWALKKLQALYSNNHIERSAYRENNFNEQERKKRKISFRKPKI